MIKLPKQWKQWVRKARLTPEGYRYPGHSFYLIGQNRYWRVNDLGDFQCSCPVEHFDRWANSRGAEMFGIPKTEKEFIEVVNRLIEESKDKV